ncbi:MAG: hypothetical protein AAFP22_07560 [Planctomycetota bacterium]
MQLALCAGPGGHVRVKAGGTSLKAVEFWRARRWIELDADGSAQLTAAGRRAIR